MATGIPDSEGVTTAKRPTSLPPLHRHIASTNNEGKSTYVESPPQQYFIYPDIAGVSRSYSASSVPTILAGEQDVKAYLGPEGSTTWTRPHIASRASANLFVSDILPGAVSAMHRTVSLDFSISIGGKLIHELDSEKKVTLKPELGASPRTPAAEPFEIGGRMLEEQFLTDDPGKTVEIQN
ncbi:hypothetical protein LTR93_011318 [Exophiala xenobiotica]|nr:hypothetical protein LTR93_011318 [Exophiala xenobiotica]